MSTDSIKLAEIVLIQMKTLKMAYLYDARSVFVFFLLLCFHTAVKYFFSVSCTKHADPSNRS